MKQHLLPQDGAFFQQLRDLDKKFFQGAKKESCPWCKGRLDTANFHRKTRGMGTDSEIRYSLCCRRPGCRKRLTPKSLRFFGRRVYWAGVFILAVDFLKELGMVGKIARQTIARWIAWWKEHLGAEAPFGKVLRGRVPPGTSIPLSPGPLLGLWNMSDSDSWLPVLEFFTPKI